MTSNQYSNTASTPPPAFSDFLLTSATAEGGLRLLCPMCDFPHTVPGHVHTSCWLLLCKRASFPLSPPFCPKGSAPDSTEVERTEEEACTAEPALWGPPGEPHPPRQQPWRPVWPRALRWRARCCPWPHHLPRRPDSQTTSLSVEYLRAVSGQAS